MEKGHLDREAAMKANKLSSKSQSGPEEPEEPIPKSTKEIRIFKFGDKFGEFCIFQLLYK